MLQRLLQRTAPSALPVGAGAPRRAKALNLVRAQCVRSEEPRELAEHGEREAGGYKRLRSRAFVRQWTALRSLVDNWGAMTPDQRKRVLATIFRFEEACGEV